MRHFGKTSTCLQWVTAWDEWVIRLAVDNWTVSMAAGACDYTTRVNKTSARGKLKPNVDLGTRAGFESIKVNPFQRNSYKYLCMWWRLNALTTTGSLCLNRFKTVGPVGSFETTFGLSSESEQIPYVLKQGSPDMSCVVMTTCNRKDKNKCLSFTGSKCNSCVHRETCLTVSSGRHSGFKLSAASCPQHENTLFFLSSASGCWECRTLRMELSCRVCLVSYPSRRHRRVVLPDPANSDRFKSAKPSCRRTQV